MGNCCEGSETAEFKPTALTYRPSNAMFENQHPTTPTNARSTGRIGSKADYTVSTDALGQPHYTGAVTRYKRPRVPRTKNFDLYKASLNKSEQTSTPSVHPGNLPDGTSNASMLSHVSEMKKYHKNLIEGPAGRGLTRAERDLLAQIGDGHLLGKFEKTGGKLIKRHKKVLPPPKDPWQIPLTVWVAKNKFLKHKKAQEDDKMKVIDKLIDQGEKWQKKKESISKEEDNHNLESIRSPKKKKTHPKYTKTKVDGQPALTSFDGRPPWRGSITGYTNFTGPNSIPRMLKGYSMVESYEPPQTISVGTQLRNICACGPQCATYALPIIKLSCGSVGSTQWSNTFTHYSPWPNYNNPLSNRSLDEDCDNDFSTFKCCDNTRNK